ncbi:MAG: O-antigen ligase family protein [Pseudomonadota bacterium]
MPISATTPRIRLFALFAFVLTAMPKTNLKVGPIPIYLVDVLILMLIFAVPARPPAQAGRLMFAGTVTLIMMIAMISEASGALKFGTPLDSAYIAGRTLLAFSVFFLVSNYIRSIHDMQIVLKGAVAGLLVTASLMILTSLPMTRAQVSDLIFSQRFLEPAADSVSGILADSPDRGVRGRTLIGVSIIGASFINACWPLAALLLRWPGHISIWRNVALIASILAPLGVLFSYSRGPILASALIVVAAILLNLRHVRRGIVLPVLVGITIVGSVGIGSQLFYFERLENSFQAIFDNPQHQQSESERLLAYSEPLGHVLNHPSFVLFGEGVAVRYSGATSRSDQYGQATHSVFAVAYYSYGLIAAVLYISLILRSLMHSGHIAISYHRTFNGFIAQAVFLSILALTPWTLLGHAPVSTPRGAMLFFLIIGLATTLTRITVPKPVTRLVQSNYAYRPNPAVR